MRRTDSQTTNGLRAWFFRWQYAGMVFLLVLLLLSGGCVDDEAREEVASDERIEKVFERGPMKATIELSADEIAISDTLELTIRAEVDEGYEVELPGFGEKLEQFGIVDFRDSQPAMVSDSKVEVSRTYELEPFLSGEYVIPPMTITFWRDDEDDRHAVETEEVKVTVTSLLPEDYSELEIKPLAGPVALPRKATSWLAPLAAAFVVLAASAAAFMWWRRRKSADTVVEVIPPHELAFRSLEALAQDDLIERGKFKLFYIRLSDVLRRYLENRFGLHAPERTTEEFLAELRHGDVLSREHKSLLRDFLNHCDMVKFAEHTPETAEIQQTFDTCKQFIMDTQNTTTAEAEVTGG